MQRTTKAAQEQKEAAENEAAQDSDTLLPQLDLFDAAVKKLIRAAKKRGYVTHDQINSVSDEVDSEQIETLLAMFTEMGVNVVETEETGEDKEQNEGLDEESEGEGGPLAEVRQKVPAKSKPKEPIERTDDPVRMYLREMGSVELLSREGEVAIAKRIEAGREALIAGLCESPLTFQAIVIWRDELNEGKVCCATSSISKQPTRAPTPRPCPPLPLSMSRTRWPTLRCRRWPSRRLLDRLGSSSPLRRSQPHFGRRPRRSGPPLRWRHRSSRHNRTTARR